MTKVFNRAIKLGGQSRTINGVEVQALEYDGDSNILLCTGTTVPTADSSGFAKGCLFIKTDAADGTKGLYENQGTSTASDFNLVGDISGAEIANDAVSLEHLDSGITPSHIVVYAGEFTWSGGGASVAHTVTGAKATDIVIATIQTAPTQDAYIKSAAVTDNTVTVTLSAANTSNDAVIAYQVIRAAA